MAHRLLDGVSSVGASRSLRVHNILDHTVYCTFKSLAAVKVSAVTLNLQGSEKNTDNQTGVISDPVLAIGSTAERVANGAFDFLIKETSYSKAAVAAGSVFTAAHVISASSWGVILIYINAAGLIITTVPLATQAYASAALAQTAADTQQVIDLGDSSKCYIGRILINSDGTTWTANTDDMTDASDLVTATFISETSTFTDIVSHTFTADEITAQKAIFHVANMGARFVRLYLSTLTGTGEVIATWNGAKRAGG